MVFPYDLAIRPECVRVPILSSKKESSSAKRTVADSDLVVQISAPGFAFEEPLTNDPSVRVINKADLIGSNEPRLSDRIYTSATSGLGIDRLMQAIADFFAGNFPTAGSPVPLTNRQVDCLERASAAELAGEMRAMLMELVEGSS